MIEKIDEVTTGLLNTILTIPQDVFDLLKTPLDGLSWLINGIYEIIITIPEMIQTLLNYLNPFSEQFILKIAFVPTQTDRTDLLITQLRNKFGQIDDIITSFENLKSYEETGQPPTFKINFNGQLGTTGEYSIIDFSFYEQYRPWVHTFTVMVAWFYFLKRLINYLPDIVY